MKTIFTVWFLVGYLVTFGQAEMQSLINSILFQDRILQPGNFMYDAQTGTYVSC